MGSSLQFRGEGFEIYKIQLVMHLNEEYVLDLTNLSQSVNQGPRSIITGSSNITLNISHPRPEPPEMEEVTTI